MGYPAPTALNIQPAALLQAPPMVAERVQAPLENANFLWLNHQPPVVDHCPSWTAGVTRTIVFMTPIIPSADAIEYATRCTLVTAASTTVTVAIAWATGAQAAVSGGTWTTLTTTTATTTAGARTDVDATVTIPANAECLRWTVTRGSGAVEVHHLLATPAPAAVPTAQTASGFVPYEDGVLSVPTAPIHVEHLARPIWDAWRIVRDRRQIVASLCCEAVIGTGPVFTTASTITRYLPVMRCWLPFQTAGNVLLVSALASTTGAAALADAVTVEQVLDPFDATMGELWHGADTYTTLQATPNGELEGSPMGYRTQRTKDGLGSYIDLRVGIKAKAGQTTTLHALSVWLDLVAEI